ncbi:MAG: RidA family protein [Candidatus Binatota bacterium]
MKRETIHTLKAASHKNPIPQAVKIGNILFTSAITGQDPNTLSIPEDPRQQIFQAFENLKAIVEAAGATLDNVGKVNVWLRDFKLRDVVNEAWVKYFPGDKPARMTLQTGLLPEASIELDAVAVL